MKRGWLAIPIFLLLLFLCACGSEITPDKVPVTTDIVVSESEPADEPAPVILVGEFYSLDSITESMLAEPQQLLAGEAVLLKEAILASEEAELASPETNGWVDGLYDCAISCGISVDGKVLAYSTCGILQSIEEGRSLRLTEEAINMFYEVLSRYVHLESEELILEEPVPEIPCHDFEAQAVRTNGYSEGAEYPQVKLICSHVDLEDYCARNRNTYDLSEFEEATEKYDEVWFDGRRQLLMVLVGEGSESVRHEVTMLTDAYVVIDRTVPEVGTDDKTQWHILVETEDSFNIRDDFRVVLTQGEPGRRTSAPVTGVMSEMGPVDISAPPCLSVEIQGQSVDAMTGIVAWNYWVGKDSWSGMEGDAAHPLDAATKNYMPRVAFSVSPETGWKVDTDAFLNFSPLDPDIVTVRCWKEEYWGDMEKESECENVPMFGERNIELKDGSYIYEVVAQWTDAELYNGTIHYSFFASSVQDGE